MFRLNYSITESAPIIAHPRTETSSGRPGPKMLTQADEAPLIADPNLRISPKLQPSRGRTKEILGSLRSRTQVLESRSRTKEMGFRFTAKTQPTHTFQRHTKDSTTTMSWERLRTQSDLKSHLSVKLLVAVGISCLIIPSFAASSSFPFTPEMQKLVDEQAARIPILLDECLNFDDPVKFSRHLPCDQIEAFVKKHSSKLQTIFRKHDDPWRTNAEANQTFSAETFLFGGVRHKGNTVSPGSLDYIEKALKEWEPDTRRRLSPAEEALRSVRHRQLDVMEQLLEDCRNAGYQG